MKRGSGGRGGGVGARRRLDRRRARRRLADRRLLHPGEAADARRLRVALGGDREEAGRRRGGPRLLELEDGVVDEPQAAAVDVERPLVDLGRVLRPAVGDHHLGDDPVLVHRLLDQLLRLVDLGELDVVARVVRLQVGHLLVDGDRRRRVVVLLVVVGEHLVLGARLVDQPLPVVELGELLVDLEPRRVELDDLLVDRDRLDEEPFGGVLLGDLGEEVDGLVDPLDAGVEVADPVEGVDVVRVVRQQLAVLADRRLDLAAGDVLLRGLHHLLALDRHQQGPSARGSTGRKVRRWTGDGPIGRQRLQVLGHAVALVVGEAVLRIAPVELDHHPVALHLGDDRGAGDRVAEAVAAHQRDAGEAEAGEPHGVHHRAVGRRAETRQRLAHGEAGGFEDVDLVDDVGGHRGDGDGDRVRADRRGRALALRSGEALAVVHAGHQAAAVEDHRGGDHRAGERAAAHLVDPGDQAVAAARQPRPRGRGAGGDDRPRRTARSASEGAARAGSVATPWSPHDSFHSRLASLKPPLTTCAGRPGAPRCEPPCRAGCAGSTAWRGAPGPGG